MTLDARTVRPVHRESFARVVADMPLDSAPGPMDGAHDTLIPQRYEAWADGIYLVAAGTKDADIVPTVQYPLPAGSRSGRQRVTNRPLWIAQLGRTVDTGEPLVLLSYLTLAGSYQEAWIDRGQITDARQLGLLGAAGVPVDSLSVRSVLAYLRECELVAARVRPIVSVGSRSGPYLYGGQWGFLLGGQWLGPGTLIADPRRRSRHAQAYHPWGSWDAWREKWSELYHQSWVTRWIVACSFAAPLLRHMGCRTFLVHQWSPSGSGKSASCHFGLSVWGDPELLYGSQNTTQIAVTEVFKHLTDLPVLFDEKQVATISSEELIYSVCGLRTRDRGHKAGGLRQDNVSWFSLAYSTGEVPLVTTHDLGGQLARVLQIHTPAFAMKREAEAIYSFTRAHHGHAGPPFLALLMQVVNSPDGLETLRALHADLRADIAATAGQDGNHAGYCATIALAQILSASWLLGIPAAQARDTALADAGNALRETWPVQSLSYAERALGCLQDHWIQNLNLYGDESGDLDAGEKEKKYSRQGFMVGVERPEAMVYIRSGADQILTDAGYEPERVWRDFGALGWLGVSRVGLHTTASLRGGKSPRHPVYAIDGRVFYTADRAKLHAVAGGGLPAGLPAAPTLSVVPGGGGT